MTDSNERVAKAIRRKRGEKLEKLLSNEEFQIVAQNFVAAVVLDKPDVLLSILSDPSHPQFFKLLEFFAERGYGKVATEIKGELKHLPVVALPEKDDDIAGVDAHPVAALEQPDARGSLAEVDDAEDSALLGVHDVPVESPGLSPGGERLGEVL